MVSFMRNCVKILYSEADYRRQYGACVLHAGHLRLDTHTHTHTHVVWYCFSTATMVARSCLNDTLYVDCLYCCNCDEKCLFSGASWTSQCDALNVLPSRTVPRINLSVTRISPLRPRLDPRSVSMDQVHWDNFFLKELQFPMPVLFPKMVHTQLHLG
jgi:hypothetical protein